MDQETERLRPPIWLLGDSKPVHCPGDLKPLDKRHPTRHNIWTPILDEIQDHLFRECKRRLDADRLYVRNAVGNPDHRRLKSEREKEIGAFCELVSKHQPFLEIIRSSPACGWTPRWTTRPACWGAERVTAG